MQDPAIRGSGAHPGRGWCVFFSFENRTQNSRVGGASPTTRPSGIHRGIWNTILSPPRAGLGPVPKLQGGWCKPNHQPIGGSDPCVFYYCRTYYKAVRVGGGGAQLSRDLEPPGRVYLLLQYLLQSCSRVCVEGAVCVFITAGPIIKLCARVFNFFYNFFLCVCRACWRVSDYYYWLLRGSWFVTLCARH